MHIAIDTNCILPGQVGGIENYSLALVDSLKLPESPASKLLLLTRPENQELFSKFTDARTHLALLDRPKNNWTDAQTLADFQARKLRLLQQHGVDLLHCPGNTINPIEVNLPVVLNLHDLQHRHFPQYFTAQELANREQWWVASAIRADALIAASNFVRDDLNMQLGIQRSKIFVTPDVFESSFLNAPSTKTLQNLQKKLKLPETFFLYPAAVWPHKNHARLINAFRGNQSPRCPADPHRWWTRPTRRIHRPARHPPPRSDRHKRSDRTLSPGNRFDLPQPARKLEHSHHGSHGLRLPRRLLQRHQPSRRNRKRRFAFFP